MDNEKYLISFNMIPKDMEKLANFSKNTPFGNNSSGSKKASAAGAIAAGAIAGILTRGKSKRSKSIKLPKNEKVIKQPKTVPTYREQSTEPTVRESNNLSTVDNNLQPGRFKAQSPTKLNVPNISNKIAFSEKMKMMNINDAEKIRYKPSEAGFIKGPKNLALEKNKPYGPFPEKPIFKGVQREQLGKYQSQEKPLRKVFTSIGDIKSEKARKTQGFIAETPGGVLPKKTNDEIRAEIREKMRKIHEAEQNKTTNSATENRKEERNSPEIDENNPE